MAFPPRPLDMWMTTWDFGLERIATTEDQAQFSLWHQGSPDDGGLASLAHGAYNAWVDSVDSALWTNAVYLRSTICTVYNAAGKEIRKQNYAPDPPWIGTGAAPSLPWETSLAVSTYSYVRGNFVENPRQSRGRFYLPPMRAGVLDASNSGYFADANLPGLLADMVDFVRHSGDDQLGVSIGPPIIFSRVAGAHKPLAHLYMDAKIDSQRRRQNREVAGHIGADV